MWYGGNAFHNAVTVRNASFARLLPKLMVKFVRVPAMFGGLAIGAFAWVQYQATRMSRSFNVCHPTNQFEQRLETMLSTSSPPPLVPFPRLPRVYSELPRMWPNKRNVDGKIPKNRSRYPNG